MRLFSGTNSLTANDDSNNTYGDGSDHFFDSVIDWTFTTGGTYMVTVGQLWYSTQEALLGYDQDRTYNDYTWNSQDHGAWRLTFDALSGSVSNVRGGYTPDPVPEPATMLLFGTGLAGLAGLRRRQGKK